MCNKQLKFNNMTFQIFGVDFIVHYLHNGKLGSRILEINIGPGMTSCCNRDKQMRIKLHKDMLSLVGVFKNKNNGFSQIY